MDDSLGDPFLPLVLEQPPLQSLLCQDEPLVGDVAPVIIPSNSASISLVISEPPASTSTNSHCHSTTTTSVIAECLLQNPITEINEKSNYAGYTEDANGNFKVGEGKDCYGGGEYEIN